MIVAVSMTHRAGDHPLDAIPLTYLALLAELGLTPALIPNYAPDPAGLADALGVQGVVLTGGGDVAPERYWQPNHGSLQILTARDATEDALLAYAVERRLPVLGICRGLQVINVFFGGGLIQDLPTQHPGALVHEGGGPHPVTITEPAFAAAFGADGLTVNTFHHQGVTPAILAPDLIGFAATPDGLIEGVAHRTLPILGVQWHPERLSPSHDPDRRWLTRFWQGAWWLDGQ